MLRSCLRGGVVGGIRTRISGLEDQRPVLFDDGHIWRKVGDSNAHAAFAAADFKTAPLTCSGNLPRVDADSLSFFIGIPVAWHWTVCPFMVDIAGREL